jgi:hypothetical protein
VNRDDIQALYPDEEERLFKVDQKGHAMNTFETGATRSEDVVRDDPDGYLSPYFLDRYFKYMTKHRVQADGAVRESDNWQKGIPLERYMKGLWRHFFHMWQRHRGVEVTDPLAADSIEEDMMAMMFNLQGYAHEYLKDQRNAERETED